MDNVYVYLDNLKKLLINVMKYYLHTEKGQSDEIERVNRVERLCNIVSHDEKLVANHEQLRDMLSCLFFYTNHQEFPKTQEQNLNHLLILLMKPFAQTLPRQQALQIAKILSTHEPNKSDMRKILEL